MSDDAPDDTRFSRPYSIFFGEGFWQRITRGDTPRKTSPYRLIVTLTKDEMLSVVTLANHLGTSPQDLGRTGVLDAVRLYSFWPQSVSPDQLN